MSRCEKRFFGDVPYVPQKDLEREMKKELFLSPDLVYVRNFPNGFSFERLPKSFNSRYALLESNRPLSYPITGHDSNFIRGYSYEKGSFAFLFSNNPSF